MRLKRGLYVMLARAKVQPDKNEEYLAFRRDEILPQMSAWGGYVFSILLRRLGTEREYLLVNAWESKAAVESWTATDAEAKLRAKAKGILAEPLESLGEYEEVHL